MGRSCRRARRAALRAGRHLHGEVAEGGLGSTELCVGVIPEDDALPLALNQGTPLLLASGSCPASSAYRNIAIRLQGGKVPLLRIK